jgi:hypothetical protein
MTNRLYILTRELVIVKICVSGAWAGAILGVAVLNIIEVLPGWTTMAAILTLPFVMSARRPHRRCAGNRHG